MGDGKKRSTVGGERCRRKSRTALWLLGVAVLVGTVVPLPARAQTFVGINGAPKQMLPYVTEPGAPAYQVPLGTPTTGIGSNNPTFSPSPYADTDALNMMLNQPWGDQVAADAQALGVNASAVAAMCDLESGCGANVGDSSGAQGVFQMYPAAFHDGLQTALAADPSLASQVVQGPNGVNDPVTAGIATAGYLMEAAGELQNVGISNPTVLDSRSYYQFGPQGGTSMASAPSSETMALALPMYTKAQLAANGITPTETVGQWQASVAAKIGNAAGEVVLL